MLVRHGHDPRHRIRPQVVRAVPAALSRSDAVFDGLAQILRQRFNAAHVALTDSGTSALILALPKKGTVALPAGPGLTAERLTDLLAESGKGEPREFRIAVDAFTDLLEGPRPDGEIAG